MLTPQTSLQNNTSRHGWATRLYGWSVGRLPPWQEKPDFQVATAYDRFLDSVKDLLSDFTTLEVNTVLARNISADHPLWDVDFLRQIGDDLCDWFTEHAQKAGGQKILSENSQRQIQQLITYLKDTHLPFPLSAEAQQWLQSLYQDSVDCLNFTSDRLTEDGAPQRAEYRRFLRYFQKFLTLCATPIWEQADMPPGRERQQLRKLWELVGTTSVYAQTVVGFDSDVISRINEQLLHCGLSREHIEVLIRFHTQNTEVSARSRDNLLAVLINALRAVLRR